MNELNFKKIIYPATLILMILAITVASFLTIKFITTNINAAFDINELALKEKTTKTDLEGYKLAAKKLNIRYPTETSVNTIPSSPDLEEQQ